jgi:abequosyltransferase
MANLSIVIPTYNNAKFLDYLLELQLPILEKYKIKLYICDNKCSDNTSDVINKWQTKYSFIDYRMNETHLSSSQNAEVALKLPSTKYVWLLGDRYFISERTIKYVIDSLNSDSSLDLMLLNLENFITNTPRFVYDNSDTLLSDLGHLMTCLSVTIINQKAIKELNYKYFYDSDFAHFCNLFEYLNGKNFNALWNPKFSINALSPPNLKRVNWSHDERALSVGAHNWVNSVFLLSSDYSYDSKLRCIQNFGILSKLFTFKGIALMRMRGNLTYSSYKKYSKEIGIILIYPKVFIVLMSIFPRAILKVIYALLTKLPKNVSSRIGLINI